MNFIQMAELAEILNEEYFPGSTSLSGDHIFIARPDGQEFTVWINGDGDALIGSVFIENDGFWSSFAGNIAEAILSSPKATDEASTVEGSVVEENLAEVIFSETISIKERITALDNTLAPFKERFYAFLQSGVATGCVSFGELTEPASAFSVDFYAITEKEVLFTTSENDWDNEELFTMPLSYVNDPAKWEKELTERIFNDRSFALGVFKKVEELQGHSVDTVKRASEDTDEVLLVGSFHTANATEKDVSALHVIVKSEGAVYRATDYFTRSRFANQLTGPIGGFSV